MHICFWIFSLFHQAKFDCWSNWALMWEKSKNYTCIKSCNWLMCYHFICRWRRNALEGMAKWLGWYLSSMSINLEVASSYAKHSSFGLFSEPFIAWKFCQSFLVSCFVILKLKILRARKMPITRVLCLEFLVCYFSHS